MGKPRHQAVFTVATPFPAVPTATIWENTWNEKIQTFHPEVVDRLANIQATLAKPAVITTASNPDYVVFVSRTEASVPGEALVVCVAPHHDSGNPSVVSAHETRQKKFLDPDPKTILWP